MDADTKLAPSWGVGRRDAFTGHAFMNRHALVGLILTLAGTLGVGLIHFSAWRLATVAG
jgi:hypothetical protein